MSPFTMAMEGDRRYFQQKAVDSVYMLMWPRGYWWNHGLNGYLAGRCFHDFSLAPTISCATTLDNTIGPRLAPCWPSTSRPGRAIPNCATASAAARATRIAPHWPTSGGDCSTRPSASQPMTPPCLPPAKVERAPHPGRASHGGPPPAGQDPALRRAGQFDQARAQLEKSRAYTDEVLALFYTLADLNQGLIERKEVPTFITANVKNWLDEEAKAIAAREEGVDTHLQLCLLSRPDAKLNDRLALVRAGHRPLRLHRAAARHCARPRQHLPQPPASRPRDRRPIRAARGRRVLPLCDHRRQRLRGVCL